MSRIIALQLASDWENAALFARRAARYLASPDSERLTAEYRVLARDFLRAFIADARSHDLGKFGGDFIDEAQGLLAQPTGAQQ